MMFKLIAILFACYLLFSTSAAHARTSNSQPITDQGTGTNMIEQIATDKIPYPRIDVKRVIKVFIKAVENGELILFELVMDKSKIKPEHVEYIYMLDDPIPTVKVYSTLTESISLPTVPEMQIEGVSAILDQQGRIIATIIHLW